MSTLRLHQKTFYVDGNYPRIESSVCGHGYFLDEASGKEYLRVGKELALLASDYQPNPCYAGIESIFYRYEWNGTSYPTGFDDNVVSGWQLVEWYGEEYNLSLIHI